MFLNEIDTTIAHCFLLQGLNSAEREKVIAAGHIVQIPANNYFFHQGEDAITLYILLSGRVKLSQLTPEGEQVIINYLGPGDGLGIIVALFNMEYPLSAEAIEHCEAIAWHRHTMKELMLEFPQMALNGMEMIGKRFSHLQRRFLEVSTRRVEQRVARALLRLVRQFGRRIEGGVLLDMPLSREDLAQMTGTNLYHVSRILSAWEQAGVVRTGRRQIVLQDAHKLVTIAEDLSPSET